MTERSVAHASFVIERSYDAPPVRVFAAFADPAVKRRWFAEGEGWQVDEFDVDFRVGGYERSRFRYREGPVIRNDTVYQDIVPDRRIVIAYTMTIGDTRISASLATVEFKPEGSHGSSTPSRARFWTAPTSWPIARRAAARCSRRWAPSCGANRRAPDKLH